ncbi:MAG TPA: orotidine-5'-phosphate decarboxylase [Gemmatimonadaceae bacterium]|nr:orotidine-5'-phosphate decarboxylase [Gemmatimonadaceae bacterium]
MTTAAEPIVALDVPDRIGAERLVAALGESCRFYKVGSQLFTAEGPAVVRWLRDRGCDVFLDLKFHDIPATMRGAAASAAALGVRLLTVHASAGVEGVRAAVDGAGEGCGVLAVTVLTSFTSQEIAAVWGRPPAAGLDADVARLAGIALEAGAHGIVCSGHELESVRGQFGDRLAPLVPGIRLAGGAAHDQARVMTPAAAAAAGARYLVLGRAVTAATDPAAAMQAVREQLGAL